MKKDGCQAAVWRQYLWSQCYFGAKAQRTLDSGETIWVCGVHAKSLVVVKHTL